MEASLKRKTSLSAASTTRWEADNLSLLSYADSLKCNHLFCNICTVKSMKSGSFCPVYKIPYRRRGKQNDVNWRFTVALKG
nr:protein BREAST CANCER SUSCEPTIBILITY 1 homolog [Malus domestica]XP_028949129.1 protein BREAST CANCER SUSCEPTIBILITY 1 homolog [Malus domestica]